jgi:hypothetical protein
MHTWAFGFYPDSYEGLIEDVPDTESREALEDLIREWRGVSKPSAQIDHDWSSELQVKIATTSADNRFRWPDIRKRVEARETVATEIYQIFREHSDWPTYDFVAPNPCTNEPVELTGSLHILMTMTTDSSGGMHFVVHFQPQGVIGVGLMTGDIYHGVGKTDIMGNASSSGVSESTFVNTFDLISPGSTPNFLMRDTIHATLVANGTLTTNVVNSTVEC